MSLRQDMNEITALGGKIKAKAAALKAAAEDPTTKVEDLIKEQEELKKMQNQMNTMKNEYNNNQKEAQGAGAKVVSLKNRLASNEYAQAFAFAVRNGLSQKNGRGYKETSILYDALTEGGGTPAGTDGGFLVPEDIDHRIRELKRTLNPLSEVFNVEFVTAPTGWRVVDKAPTTGMSKVNEMATIGSDDQPAFAKITYTTDKYGLIVPVSNELANDEVANLFEYLARWFARKAVLTENALILAELEKLTAKTVAAGKKLDGIKSALNKQLDPALSVDATIIVNQNAFDDLDQEKDATGRALLQPDPVNPTQYRAFGRNIKVVSNATMPGNDIYVGNGKEFATLFMRQNMEVSSTDVGGNAWKTDSIEVRGLTRMGISVFDEEAMVRLSVG